MGGGLIKNFINWTPLNDWVSIKPKQLISKSKEGAAATANELKICIINFENYNIDINKPTG